MSEIQVNDSMVYPENGVPYCSDCGYLVTCRCSWCPRCGQLTGNNTQGHYWAHIERKNGTYITTAPHHFCCPDACEHEGLEPTKSFHPRYLALLEERERAVV